MASFSVRRLAAGLAAPLMLALGGEARATSYPEVEISKAEAAHAWPFSVDAGTLTCIAHAGQQVVIFSEPWRTDVPQEMGNMTLPRAVIVSTNPLALLASLEDRELYLPWESLEQLIKLLAPWETMGRQLCARDAASPDKI